MAKTYEYKLQGDGRDSLICTETVDGIVINKYMIYDRSVASWKVKSILKLQGLYDTIETALGQLSEPTKTIADMAWKHSESINQFSPTVKLIKQVCALTDSQVQSIFDEAEQINI